MTWVDKFSGVSGIPAPVTPLGYPWLGPFRGQPLILLKSRELRSVPLTLNLCVARRLCLSLGPYSGRMREHRTQHWKGCPHDLQNDIAFSCTLNISSLSRLPCKLPTCLSPLALHTADWPLVSTPGTFMLPSSHPDSSHCAGTRCCPLRLAACSNPGISPAKSSDSLSPNSGACFGLVTWFFHLAI